MGLTCEDYNQVCVAAVEGDLSAESAQALGQMTEQRLMDRHRADFIIDLTKCPFIDSEGLETLLRVRALAEECTGRLRLCGLDEHCHKILEITRLVQRFECHDTLESALKSMG